MSCSALSRNPTSIPPVPKCGRIATLALNLDQDPDGTQLNMGRVSSDVRPWERQWPELSVWDVIGLFSIMHRGRRCTYAAHRFAGKNP